MSTLLSLELVPKWWSGSKVAILATYVDALAVTNGTRQRTARGRVDGRTE